MPEILKKANGDTDWNKFFMGFAVALVFVMQSYSQLQHSQTRTEILDIHKTYKPRVEIKRDMLVNTENIKAVLADIDRRLLKLEEVK